MSAQVAIAPRPAALDHATLVAAYDNVHGMFMAEPTRYRSERGRALLDVMHALVAMMKDAR